MMVGSHGPFLLNMISFQGTFVNFQWSSSTLAVTWTTKKPSYLPLAWLFNRDPYYGLLQFPHNWVGFHRLYTLNNQTSFFPWLTCFFLVVAPEPGCLFRWKITSTSEQLPFAVFGCEEKQLASAMDLKTQARSRFLGNPTRANRCPHYKDSVYIPMK